LKTKKYFDYILFKKAILMIKDKKHLTIKGLQDIINIRAAINKGLTYTLKKAFPNAIPVPVPLPINYLKQDKITIHPQ
jgi:hypothetical protein